MRFSAAMARVNNVLTGLLVFLLLITPICGALCDAVGCDLRPKAAEQSSCHESAGSISGEHAVASLRAERNCGLQELPVALAADFRSSRSDSLASVNVISVDRYFSFGPTPPISFTDFSNSPGTGPSADRSPLSMVPLRI